MLCGGAFFVPSGCYGASVAYLRLTMRYLGYRRMAVALDTPAVHIGTRMSGPSFAPVSHT